MNDCQNCRHLDDYNDGTWSTHFCAHRGAPKKKMGDNFLTGRRYDGTLQQTPEWCPKLSVILLRLVRGTKGNT